MENEAARMEIIFVFVLSVLIFAGFYILYASGVSLDYLVGMNSSLPQRMTAMQESFSLLHFLYSSVSPILTAVFALIIFSFSLALLSVHPLGRLKYVLAVPIFLSGILFNFSILFMFFGIGLFIAYLYVIPLGQTYFAEYRRWKFFRVGSNAVGKALFITFLFILAGSYIALSMNLQYREEFSQGFKQSMVEVVSMEVENMRAQQGTTAMEEQLVQDSMRQMRHDYPNLTEKQYSDMEARLKESLNSSTQSGAMSESEIKSIVESSLSTSPLVKSLLLWFPLIFSFTIWASLEFLRSMFFSPLSGVFSYMLFHIPIFNESAAQVRLRTMTPELEYKPEIN